MKLNEQQAIKALRNIERQRFDKGKHYAKLIASGKASGEDICDYGDKYNVHTYESIMRIAEESLGPIKKIIKESVVDFVCQLPEDSAAYHSGKMSCKQYFGQEGFSAFGMSYVFNITINNLEKYQDKKSKAFTRLGA